MTKPKPTSIRPKFNILVDTAEQNPFLFGGMYADAKEGRLPIEMKWRHEHEDGNLIWKCLGRHPNSLGDYSIEGMEGVCHVERKSIEDLYGTLLGWDGRRERFKQELENLSAIDYSMVIVEGSLRDVILAAPDYGKKTAAQNAKILNRTIISHIVNFRVHWVFADHRRLAEIFTFRYLEKCHKEFTHMEANHAKSEER